ncbi:MAG: hypothetical protein ACFE9S_19100 [Candidatus Hermodarchaeota archaeon]
MSFLGKVQEIATKVFSKWSAEFSALITAAIALVSLGLLDLIVIKVLLTIAVFVFFIGIVHKIGLSMYKQHIEFMREISKSNQVENKTNNQEGTQNV